eukprot:687854-Hanusia_phi.AAC.1
MSLSANQGQQRQKNRKKQRYSPPANSANLKCRSAALPFGDPSGALTHCHPAAPGRRPWHGPEDMMMIAAARRMACHDGPHRGTAVTTCKPEL